MELIDQIFMDGMVLSIDEIEITLKKQPTQTDYWDMSILSRLEAVDFIGNEKLQNQLAKHVSNIETYKYKGEEVNVDISGVPMMVIAVTNAYYAIAKGLTDLKKK